MKETFSLHRIMLLIRMDLIEYKTYIFYALAASIGAMVVFLSFSVSTDGAQNIHKQSMLFWLASFVIFLKFCQFIGMKVHKRKGTFMTLPANTIEKYIALLLEGTLIFIVFQVIFRISLYVGLLVIPGYTIGSFMEVAVLRNHLPMSVIYFISSTVLLSYVTFRKRAFAKSFLGYILFICFNIGLVYLFYKTKDIIMYNGFAIPSSLPYMVNALGEYFNWAMYAATLVIMYVVYLKLKEKELR